MTILLTWLSFLFEAVRERIRNGGVCDNGDKWEGLE